MNEQLQQFKEQVLQDLALAEQFKAVSDLQDFIDLAIRLGQEHGYSFTAEDLQTVLAESASADAQLELTDEQLASVAGGDGYTQVTCTACPAC